MKISNVSPRWNTIFFKLFERFGGNCCYVFTSFMGCFRETKRNKKSKRTWFCTSWNNVQFVVSLERFWYLYLEDNLKPEFFCKVALCRANDKKFPSPQIFIQWLQIQCSVPIIYPTNLSSIISVLLSSTASLRHITCLHC